MPRRIVGGAFVSADGVMQAPGGPTEDPSGGFAHGGWLAPLFEEGLGNQIDTLFGKPFDLLLGRRTYDIFAAYWPFVPMNNPIAAMFAQCGKVVVSRAGVDLTWSGSRRVESVEALAAVKAEDGPDLVIQGSGSLYPQLLAHGLLDRLITITAPLLLGQGKRLFGEGTPAKALTLIEHRVSANGIAMATYDVGGEVKTGSFLEIEPSALEQTRRRRIEEGTW